WQWPDQSQLVGNRYINQMRRDVSYSKANSANNFSQNFLKNRERKVSYLNAYYATGRIKEAGEIVETFLNDPDIQKLPTFYSQALLIKSQILAHENEVVKSAEFLGAYQEYADSLYRGIALENVGRLETEYKTKIKADSLKIIVAENQVIFQEKQLEQQKSSSYLAVGGSLVAVLSVLAFSFNRRRKVEKTAKEREQKDKVYIQHLHGELQHRVKNNLNLLNSMVALQTEREVDEGVKQALGATRSRISALALLHKILDQQPTEVNRGEVNLNDYLSKLIAQVKSLADVTHHELILREEIAPLNIRTSEALSLALILNEWITNSLKYAVPFTEQPTIRVAVNKIGNDQMVLEYEDNGPGFNKEDIRQGSFGQGLVQSQIRQLRGHLVSDTDGKVKYILKFQYI
ncbi:MAG: sensor histidine kinase, partial [Bacteroidota bacterium]